jgi:DNA-binding MarR family transcriptional regulator
MLKFNPTESAGFLVGRVAHALSLHVQEFLDEEGLDVSAEEISILTVVAHLTEPKQMKSLAELLGRDATTVSRQVAGLEKQGLAKRSRSPDDGRAFVVSITKTGTKLVERTIPMTLKLRGRAMQGISAADAKTLQRVFLQMLANLKDGD